MSTRQPDTPATPDACVNWCWYHVTLTTYGAWLPGDPRGFRTRHQREHVDGDYKNPPSPGEHGTLQEHSRASLKEPPVSLSVELRAVVGAALLERLQALGALVVCLAVSKQHVHILAKMPFGAVRNWMGAAKRHTWFVLRDHGWKGKLWGKRGKPVVVRDREHQLRVYRYILRHAQAGAWVWKWADRDGAQKQKK